jgi:hypothetical protein
MNRRVGTRWHGRRTEFVILRLTPKTAALAGENPPSGQNLQNQVRSGRWTSGPGRTRSGCGPSGPSSVWRCGRKAWWGRSAGRGHPTLSEPRALGVPVAALLEYR